MLSSITPLGQRGKGTWRRTIVAYWTGAILSGLAVFGLLGLAGETLGFTRTSGWISLGVVAVAATLDVLGAKPPGPKRQVNEDWLGKYRDWVTGFGFGLQLGSGIATIVPVYAVWALVFLTILNGLPTAILIGTGFAAGRAFPLILTKRVNKPAGLAQLMLALARYDRPMMNALFGAYFLILVVGVFGNV
jgi:hypothetical protein